MSRPGAAGRAECRRRRRIADRAYVLDDGKVVYQGDAAEFGRDEKRVRELEGASAKKWDMDGAA
jgi:ABC-type lipopolysaccharide export system ATPase subunit